MRGPLVTRRFIVVRFAVSQSLSLESQRVDDTLLGDDHVGELSQIAFEFHEAQLQIDDSGQVFVHRPSHTPPAPLLYLGPQSSHPTHASSSVHAPNALSVTATGTRPAFGVFMSMS